MIIFVKERWIYCSVDTGDGNEDKRLNKKSVSLIFDLRFFVYRSLIFNCSRCQLLSCTTEKLGKKKNRKNRLRAFPNKWNELTKENREAIRRALRK